jgi:predicted DNA-binding protein (UPF0251 family)
VRRKKSKKITKYKKPEVLQPPAPAEEINVVSQADYLQDVAERKMGVSSTILTSPLKKKKKKKTLMDSSFNIGLNPAGE